MLGSFYLLRTRKVETIALSTSCLLCLLFCDPVSAFLFGSPPFFFGIVLVTASRYLTLFEY